MNRGPPGEELNKQFASALILFDYVYSCLYYMLSDEINMFKLMCRQIYTVDTKYHRYSESLEQSIKKNVFLAFDDLKEISKILFKLADLAVILTYLKSVQSLYLTGMRIPCYCLANLVTELHVSRTSLNLVAKVLNSAIFSLQNI